MIAHRKCDARGAKQGFHDFALTFFPPPHRSFSDLNKTELAVALDKHLSSNRTIFAGEQTLADYYKRLSAPPRGGSPVKREPKVEVPPSAKKTPGRKPAAQRQEEAT